MSQIVDVSGLPQPIVDGIQPMVTSLRAELQQREPSSAEALAEFERGLEELSAGLPVLSALPNDFSRADINADHN